MSDDTPEQKAVTVRLVGYERTPACGRLLALLIAEVEIGGVVVRLQGMQLRRVSDRQVELIAPQFRARDGRWTDGVILPAEIMAEILAQVAAEVFDPESFQFFTTAPRVEEG